MTRKILVATDGSDAADRAVDCAAELSDRLGHDLCIVHVHLHGRPPREILRLADIEHLSARVAAGGIDLAARLPAYVSDYPAIMADQSNWARAVIALGEQVLDRAQARAEARGARNVTTELRTGDYADEILDLATEHDAAMIVVGRRGLGRLREALLGSVSQKVLHHAPCTVVIAH